MSEWGGLLRRVGAQENRGGRGGTGGKKKKEQGTGVLNEREVGKLLLGDHVTTVPNSSQSKKR